MNFMDKGISWFNERRLTRLTEQVLIRTATKVKEVPASVIEPESYINSEGVRVQSNTYTFLFNKSYNLDIKRGVKIIRKRDNQEYEVVAPQSQTNDINDPNNQDIAVYAKLCS